MGLGCWGFGFGFKAGLGFLVQGLGRRFWGSGIIFFRSCGKADDVGMQCVSQSVLGTVIGGGGGYFPKS